MSVEPENFTNTEWVNYNTYWTNVVVLAVLGGILTVVGFAWGQHGLSGLFVESANGVTIVEGGAGDGTFKGPFMASIGIVLVTMVPYYAGKAEAIVTVVE